LLLRLALCECFGLGFKAFSRIRRTSQELCNRALSSLPFWTVTLRAEETGCQGGSVLLESCGSASSTEGYPFVGRTSAWCTTKHKDLID
uniref:Secreted protein n=1 Tax=Brugia timori TaxID=42155 RepID=A0A0R3R4B8_9BILA